MDTTKTKWDAALPESAQQRNGAVRSAEGQRTAAGRPEKKTAQPVKKAAAPEKRREAPKKKPAAPEKAPRKKSAIRPGKAKRIDADSAAAVKAKKTAGKPQQKQESAVNGLPDSVSTKKRSYGNSKPKKKSVVERMGETMRENARKKAERSASGKTKKSRFQIAAPEVIYTEPQAVNRHRILLQLLTVMAVVAALVMGLSVFFKVEHITVTGADVYSPWTVREASGISEGDNLLTFSHARAGAQIKANLPYVNRVRFGIKLPDTVNIIIDEDDVVYSIKNQDGTWWLMNSSGRMVQQTNSGVAANYTQILGVTVQDPIADERAVATESAAVTETDPQTGETVVIPVAVTGAQRLQAALQIVQALEANDIVGDAASVDVSRIEDIILWYGTRYQVNLGNSANLDYKIDCMNDVILQMSEYQSGILDISFTIWPNQVGYTPFA